MGNPENKDLIKCHSKEDIEWKEDDFEKSKKLIFTQMKALLARDLYESSAFYRIINGKKYKIAVYKYE